MSNDIMNHKSVHLEMFPNINDLPNDFDLVMRMDIAREICASVLSVRKAENLKVRMPLSKITIYGENYPNIDDFIDIIKNETNIKEVILSDRLADVAKRTLSLDMKICGVRFGSKIGDIIKCSRSGDWEQIDKQRIKIADVILDDDCCKITYGAINNNIKALKKCAKFDIFVLVDTTINKDLEMECLARDIVRLVQQSRKAMQLAIADKIVIEIIRTDDMLDMERNKMLLDYIADQVLADRIDFVDIEAKSNNYSWFEYDLHNDIMNIGLLRSY